MLVEKNKPSTDGKTVEQVAEVQTPVAEVQAASAPAPAVQAAEAPVQMVALDPRLVALLLEDKAEEALERKKRKQLGDQKRLAGIRNSEASRALEKGAIQKCCLRNHQKGGKYRKKNAAIDTHFTVHMFIGTEVRVRCELCGLTTWGPRLNGKVPADTREVIYRDNGDGVFRPVPNPSFNPKANLPGLSFEDMMKIAKDDSSNIESRSETVIDNPVLKTSQLERENEELRAKLAALQANQ